ncbi:MAG: tripartite tricarboxylate transporter substrate binding protein [Pseudomonadota bacterium]
MKTQLNVFFRAFALTAVCLIGAQAMAQGYPNRPVKLVVPYPPGGPVDGVARGAADRLSKIWNQPVVVENKVGANEVIAADFVAKGPNDGYTILFGADPTFATNQFLFKKLPYDPIRDLVPVSRIAIVNMGIIVSGTFAPNNLKEFVSLVKANPGKFNYSAGAGTAAHVQFDAFLRQQGLDMTHIAYKGTASALQDILSGQIQATMGGITVAKPHLASGKMKLLAVNGKQRTKSVPDVPTYAEAGFPNTQAFFYVGYAVPKGTPKNVIDAITSANRKVANDAEFIEKSLDPFGYEPVTETPEQFAKFLTDDRKVAQKRIREAGARLEN